jgi:S-adenosylmethionine:tRNA ribosyltransferase-isomerase
VHLKCRKFVKPLCNWPVEPAYISRPFSEHTLKSIQPLPKLSEFDFQLPTELIAERPVDHRDDARLLVLHKDSGKIEHKLFKDAVDYFSEGDVWCANNTRVFCARLYGQKEKTGSKIEVFLLRELNQQYHLWDVNVDPARKIRVGNKLYFGENSELVAEVIDNTTSRGRTIRFLFEGDSEAFYKMIDLIGEVPLPRPQIAREPEPDDRDRFQTIFAGPVGAVAPAAASLHITKHVLKRLELKNIGFTSLTLHVGLGTFKQGEQEDLAKHKPEAEVFKVERPCADMINTALDTKKRVLAVGTSVLRAMEGSVTANNRLKDFGNTTDRFIVPNYNFRIANALISQLCLPMSQPIMMASAFAGSTAMVREAYNEAVKEKYRFFVYGDAMMIV